MKNHEDAEVRGFRDLSKNPWFGVPHAPKFKERRMNMKRQSLFVDNAICFSHCRAERVGGGAGPGTGLTFLCAPTDRKAVSGSWNDAPCFDKFDVTVLRSHSHRFAAINFNELPRGGHLI